jgi:hypothetical protein
MCPTYAKGVNNARDTKRAAIFLSEFEAHVKAGTFPQFMVMRLPTCRPTAREPSAYPLIRATTPSPMALSGRRRRTSTTSTGLTILP